MERREPGSRWTRAGGAARRRDRPAGARARGGPTAGDWAAGGAAPGRRGWAAAAGPAPRPASPVRSVRHRGGRRSLLPPPSLPARPGARSHPRPEAPSRREQRTEARKLRPAGTPRLCPAAGRASRRPTRFIGSPASPPPRRPRPFSAGALFAAPRPLPGAARTCARIRGLSEAEGPTLRGEEAPPPRAPGARVECLVTKPGARRPGVGATESSSRSRLSRPARSGLRRRVLPRRAKPS